MSSIDFATAELLAADLNGAKVDLNEAQRVLAYARSKRISKHSLTTCGRCLLMVGR